MGLHWFILSALLVFYIQSVIFYRLGHKKLSYHRMFSAGTRFQGDDIEMVEEISNRKFLPVPWLRVESQLHSGLHFHSQSNLDVSSGDIYQNHKSFFSLMPFTKITRRHKVTCAKRGVYRLRSVALTCGDLLGLRSAMKRIEFDHELLVFPRPISFRELPLPSHSWQGDLTVRRWIVEDPFMISGVREYRYGDPLKGINWNATARSGKLQVHQLDYTADHRLMIVLNVEDHEGMWDLVNDESLIEEGISMAAGIADYAISQGMETGFASNAHLIDRPKEFILVPAYSGAGHLTDLYETFARLVIARSIPFDVLLEELAESDDGKLDILLLSAYTSARIEKGMGHLRSRGHAVDLIVLEGQASPSDRRRKAGETA